MIEGLIKGDSIIFEVNSDEDITDWKVRAELWDSGTVDIKKATANSGGSDAQIEITIASEGVFLIKIDAGQTTNVADQAFLEIEMENTEGKIWTTYQSIIKFVNERIKWTTP